MIRLLLRVALLVTIALSAALLLIHLHAYDASKVTGFFAAGSCTSMPCWQGIRPGETTDMQALAILKAHPWVEDISQVDADQNTGSTHTTLIYWKWSKAYPFAGNLPYDQEGILIAHGGIVEQIYLTTDILFGDMWLALGAPDGGTVDYVYDSSRLRVDNTALFAQNALAATASTFANCNLIAPDYWRTPVYLWLQDRPAPQPDHVAYDVYLAGMNSGFQRIRSTFC